MNWISSFLGWNNSYKIPVFNIYKTPIAFSVTQEYPYVDDISFDFIKTYSNEINKYYPNYYPLEDVLVKYITYQISNISIRHDHEKLIRGAYVYYYQSLCENLVKDLNNRHFKRYNTLLLIIDLTQRMFHISNDVRQHYSLVNMMTYANLEAQIELGSLSNDNTLLLNTNPNMDQNKMLSYFRSLFGTNRNIKDILYLHKE